MQNRDEQKIIEKHKAEAKKLGDNPHHYKRTDATGALRPDSGVSVFQESGINPEFADLSYIHENLLEHGYHLGSASLLRKDGDHMFFLFLTYEKEVRPDSLPNLFLKGADFLKEMKNVYARIYQHVFIYTNPDESVTVNPSHVSEEEPRFIVKFEKNEKEKLAISWAKISRN